MTTENSGITETPLDTSVTESEAPESTEADVSEEISDDPLSAEAFEKWRSKENGESEKKEEADKSSEDSGDHSKTSPEVDKSDSSKEEPTKDEEKEAEPSEDKETPTPQKITLKVKGETKEVTLEEATVLAQKGLGAEAKFEEAAKIRQMTDRFLQKLKENPFEVLKNPKLGINVREMAEDFLFNELQQEQMTPEQREAVQNKQELERMRAEEEKRAATEKEREAEELKERYRQDYQNQIIDALENAQLPKTDWTVARMAGYMRQAAQKGMTTVRPADIAPLVAKDWQKVQQQMYQSMDGSKIVESLGQDAVDKIRKHTVEQYKKTQSTPEQKPVTQTRKTRTPKKRFTSYEQIREHLDL